MKDSRSAIWELNPHASMCKVEQVFQDVLSGLWSNFILDEAATFPSNDEGVDKCLVRGEFGITIAYFEWEREEWFCQSGLVVMGVNEYILCDILMKDNSKWCELS